MDRLGKLAESFDRSKIRRSLSADQIGRTQTSGNTSAATWGQRHKELRYHPASVAFDVTFPICVTNIGLHKVKDIILAQGDRMNRQTNVKADMTEWYMHRKHEVFKAITDDAMQWAKENSPHPVEMEVFDCWGSIGRRGDFTKIHDHWPHPWAFCYYAEVDETTQPIIFPDGQGEAHVVKPQSGDIALFPGWLYHGVEKSTTDSERVIVAGNLSFKSMGNQKV